MKSLFISFHLFVSAMCFFVWGKESVVAQSLSQDTLSVHAGAVPLSELLTAEQKRAVKVLNVTGTLRNEDYAFLRTELLKQLQTLNLRDAEIDTIPAHAFCWDFLWSDEPQLKFVLPERLKCVGDSAFFTFDDDISYEVVLTGKFPQIGKHSLVSCCYMFASSHTLSIASDNLYCKEIINDDGLSFIYSADSSTLYFVNGFSVEITLPSCTKIIGPRAFEFRNICSLILPSGVDSIGDYAFLEMMYDVPVVFSHSNKIGDYNWTGHGVICESITPPKLGKICSEREPYALHMLNSSYIFYVPVQSLDVYKSAEGWKDLNIRGIGDFINYGPDDNLSVKNDDRRPYMLHKKGTGYILQGFKPIEMVRILDGGGNLLKICHGDKIPYSDYIEIDMSQYQHSGSYILICVNFEDGTQETIKLVY